MSFPYSIPVPGLSRPEDRPRLYSFVIFCIVVMQCHEVLCGHASILYAAMHILFISSLVCNVISTSFHVVNHLST